MNRILAALEFVNSAVLNEEIEHQLSVDREEPGYTIGHALDDLYDIAVDNNDRSVMTPARKVLVELGCYRHISDEELSRTFSTGKKYDFILAGKKYVWAMSPNAALNQ
jgi:hypothetical protein